MPPTSNTTASVQQPRLAVRAVVSALVIFHVGAVFVGPFAMPPGNSDLSATLAGFYKPYVETLALANGYKFFAPEPGPSHLVRYEITRADGTRVEGFFPNRNQHFPRLLYHRYFMLSEFINSIDNPERPSPEATAFARAYAEHLAAEHQGKSVKLFLRRHYVPRTEEVRRGMRLDDKALYQERPLYTFTDEKPADANP